MSKPSLPKPGWNWAPWLCWPLTDTRLWLLTCQVRAPITSKPENIRTAITNLNLDEDFYFSESACWGCTAHPGPGSNPGTGKRKRRLNRGKRAVSLTRLCRTHTLCLEHWTPTWGPSPTRTSCSSYTTQS